MSNGIWTTTGPGRPVTADHIDRGVRPRDHDRLLGVGLDRLGPFVRRVAVVFLDAAAIEPVRRSAAGQHQHRRRLKEGVRQGRGDVHISRPDRGADDRNGLVVPCAIVAVRHVDGLMFAARRHALDVALILKRVEQRPVAVPVVAKHDIRADRLKGFDDRGRATNFCHSITLEIGSDAGLAATMAVVERT